MLKGKCDRVLTFWTWDWHFRQHKYQLPSHWVLWPQLCKYPHFHHLPQLRWQPQHSKIAWISYFGLGLLMDVSRKEADEFDVLKWSFFLILPDWLLYICKLSDLNFKEPLKACRSTWFCSMFNKTDQDHKSSFIETNRYHFEKKEESSQTHDYLWPHWPQSST